MATTNGDHNRVNSHPYTGKDYVFRPDLPVWEGDDDGDGILIVAPGLDMLYVRVRETGYRTHVTPKDLSLGSLIGP